jgi:hypothetical protein
MTDDSTAIEKGSSHQFVDIAVSLETQVELIQLIDDGIGLSLESMPMGAHKFMRILFFLSAVGA